MFETALLYASFIIGGFLRLYHLGNYGLWYDEVYSVMMSQNIPLFIQDRAYVFTPPLFFILLKAWSLISRTEGFLFLLPFTLGMLSLFMIYKVGVLLSGRRAGAIGALLLAISPFHIHYSQELRMYSLVVFLTLVSVYYFVRCAKYNNRTDYLALTFFNCLLLYTHYTAIFLIFSELFFATFLFKQKRDVATRLLFSFSAAFLLFLPWAFSISNQLLIMKAVNRYASAGSLGWMPQASWGLIFNLFRSFNLGFSSGDMLHCAGLLVFSPFFFAGCLEAWKRSGENRFLLAWLLFPAICAILISKLIISSFVFRNLIGILPAYCIITALGISKLKRPLFLGASIAAIVLLSVPSLRNYYANLFPLKELSTRPGIHPRLQQRQAAEYVAQGFKQGDIIVHASRATFQPFRYYHKEGLDEVLLADEKGKNPLFEEDREIIKKSLYSALIYKAFHAESEPVEWKKIEDAYPRVWLICSDWDGSLPFDRSLGTAGPGVKYALLSARHFQGINVCLYGLKGGAKGDGKK